MRPARRNATIEALAGTITGVAAILGGRALPPQHGHWTLLVGGAVWTALSIVTLALVALLHRLPSRGQEWTRVGAHTVAAIPLLLILIVLQFDFFPLDAPVSSRKAAIAVLVVALALTAAGAVISVLDRSIGFALSTAILGACTAIFGVVVARWE